MLEEDVFYSLERASMNVERVAEQECFDYEKEAI